MKRMIKKSSGLVAVFVAALLIASSCSTLGIPSSEEQAVSETGQVSDVDVVASSEVVDSGYRSFLAAPNQISLHWKNTQGEPYGQLEGLRQDLEGQGKTVRLVTNAGIFSEGLTPGGLHIEAGTELRSINLLDAEGNFQLLPNGVFYIADGTAGILESNAYVASGIQPRLVTQSGPQLLADGVIHPEFSETSDNVNIRNGVGITSDGQVLFLRSVRDVTFWDFATEFLDRGITNALYLDGGNHSVMDEPVDGVPLFPNLPIAGILAVSE